MSLIHLAVEDNEAANHTGNITKVTSKASTAANTIMMEADKPSGDFNFSRGGLHVAQTGAKSDDVPMNGIESIVL